VTLVSLALQYNCFKNQVKPNISPKLQDLINQAIRNFNTFAIRIYYIYYIYISSNDLIKMKKKQHIYVIIGLVSQVLKTLLSKIDSNLTPSKIFRVRLNSSQNFKDRLFETFSLS